MARHLFFNPSHHIFNLQKHSLHRSPLVKATFTVKGIIFSGVAMLDSGCSTRIVPISRLPKEAKKHMTHFDVHIKGINGSITALGELHCNINRDSPIFEDINVVMTTQDTPILIGQNILAHNILDSYIIDNQNGTVEFRRTLTSGYTVHTTPIIPSSTLPHSPAHGALTIHNNNQPTIGPQPNIRTLDQKQLVETKCVSIVTKSPKPWWIGSHSRPTHSLRRYYRYWKRHQRYIHPSCPYTN